MPRNLALFHKMPLGEERIAELKKRYNCTVIQVTDFDFLKYRRVLYAENRNTLDLSLYPVTGIEAYMKRVGHIDHLNIVGHFRDLYLMRIRNSWMRILKGEWEPNMLGNCGEPELFLRMLGKEIDGKFVMQDLVTIDVKLPEVKRYPTFGTYPVET